MSLVLRLVPAISHRSKPLSFFSIPLFTHSLKSKPKFIPRRKQLCTLSSSSSPSPSIETLTPTTKPVIPIKDSLQWVTRTAYCGDLSANDIHKRVHLCGWVALHRIHGGVTFLNLRDHTGILQITMLSDQFPDHRSAVNEPRLEYVVYVEGVVRSRPPDAMNHKMKTGTIEVAAEHVQVLNSVKSKLPFLVTSGDDVREIAKEEIRLRYRCLDLRREQMSCNLMLHHRMVKLIRRYLEDVHDFVEID